MVKGQSYALPSDATWTSSDPGTVQISSRYKAKALKATGNKGVDIYNGSSKDGSTACYTAYVVDPYLVAGSGKLQERVTKALPLVVGESLELSLAGMDGMDDEYDVFWQTSNAEVAKVDDGKVYAAAKGNAKVTAYVNGKAFTASLKVSDASSIKYIGASVTLKPLQTVTIKFADGFKVKNAAWTSDHDMKPVMNKSGKKVSYYQDGVVRITPSGTLSGNSLAATAGKGKYKGIVNGIARVACTYDPYETGGFTYRTTVYVEEPKLKATSGDGLVIKNSAATKGQLVLKEGSKFLLKVDGVYQPVTFDSSKNNIAFADEAGVVYARAKGKAVLSARVNGKKLTVNVTVE